MNVNTGMLQDISEEDMLEYLRTGVMPPQAGPPEDAPAVEEDALPPQPALVPPLAPNALPRRPTEFKRRLFNFRKRARR
jgi:hypothetical protein